MTQMTAQPRRAWVQQIMGLPISLHLRGPSLSAPQVEAAVAQVYAELRQADEIFSPYKVDSQLSRWDRSELALNAAHPHLAEVVALCEEARQLTGGYFDARDLPDPIGPGLRFDPSGLVKGWAVQRAARHLAQLHDHGWCLNAGGDVVVHSPDVQADWRVGIEDPADRTQLLQAISARSGAIATSGTAARGTHIMNPRTGEPAAGLQAVTVTGPSLLWADVYATATMAAGRWLPPADGYEALLVDLNGTISTTPAWPGLSPVASVHPRH